METAAAHDAAPHPRAQRNREFAVDLHRLRVAGHTNRPVAHHDEAASSHHRAWPSTSRPLVRVTDIRTCHHLQSEVCHRRDGAGAHTPLRQDDRDEPRSSHERLGPGEWLLPSVGEGANAGPQ